MKLMQDMRNDGLTLKQNALGRVLDKDDPNQVKRSNDRLCFHVMNVTPK